MGKKGQQVWTEGSDEEHFQKVFTIHTLMRICYFQNAALNSTMRNTGSNLPAQIDLYPQGDEYNFLALQGGSPINIPLSRKKLCLPR